MDVIAALETLAQSLEKNAAMLEKAKMRRVRRRQAFRASGKTAKPRRSRKTDKPTDELRTSPINTNQVNKVSTGNWQETKNNDNVQREEGWSPQWASSNIASEIALDERLKQLGDYRAWGNRAAERNNNIPSPPPARHEQVTELSNNNIPSPPPARQELQSATKNDCCRCCQCVNPDRVTKSDPNRAITKPYSREYSHNADPYVDAVDARTRQTFLKYPYPGYGEPSTIEDLRISPRRRRDMEDIESKVQSSPPRTGGFANDSRSSDTGVTRQSIGKAEEALAKALDAFESLSSRLGRLEAQAQLRGNNHVGKQLSEMA
jgi:hypothetical protein